MKAQLERQADEGMPSSDQVQGEQPVQEAVIMEDAEDDGVIFSRRKLRRRQISSNMQETNQAEEQEIEPAPRSTARRLRKGGETNTDTAKADAVMVDASNSKEDEESAVPEGRFKRKLRKARLDLK